MKLIITKLAEINAKKDGRHWNILHTVEQDGSVKTHFLSDEQIKEFAFDPKSSVSDLSKGEVVELNAEFNSRGQLIEITNE
jgi:hypothetical protein